jgi:hypothetical protein
MIKDWILKKLFKNYGRVGFIIRSGQPGIIRLYIMYWLFGFKSVINLANSPKTDKHDLQEYHFCFKRRIPYLGYTFGAGGPQPLEDLANKIVDILIDSSTMPKPIWIHCEGGKDRTGGIVMRWMLKNGYTLEKVIQQAVKHKVPAEGWLKWALNIKTEQIEPVY